MRVVVTLGTRPEIIRLYHTIKLLRNSVELSILFTGQNYEKNLSLDIFNDPRFGDVYEAYDFLPIGEKKYFIDQIGPITQGISDYLFKVKPNKVLILGDTNSALFTALAAVKLNIPIYHMEAGNRCFDNNSPEEANRKLIDSIADVHMCYTHHSVQNLIYEGVPKERIHTIGNPMAEFEEFHYPESSEETILATFHRQENDEYVTNIIAALSCFTEEYEVIACMHPRYIDRVEGAGFTVMPSVNFSDFVKLEKNAKVIVTDSGTVCEEAAMLGIPSVILRNTTERPELFDCGNTILVGGHDVDRIIRGIYAQLESPENGEIPMEYDYQQVSLKVRNIIVGKGNFV